MRAGQPASACAVTGGTWTGSGGRSSRCGLGVPETSATLPLVASPPTTRTSTTTARTTGTRTAMTITATRRSGSSRRGGPPGSSGLVSSVRASEVDDGAGQRAGDPVDGLHPGHDETAQLVHGLGLGADDDVVGPGHVLGLGHAVDLADRRGNLRGLADFGLDEDVGVDHGRPFLGQRCHGAVRACDRAVPAGWRSIDNPTGAPGGRW